MKYICEICKEPILNGTDGIRTYEFPPEKILYYHWHCYKKMTDDWIAKHITTDKMEKVQKIASITWDEANP